MTLGTVIQLIKEDLSRFNSADDDRIRRAIIRSQKDHQNKPYYFLKATDKWLLTIGKKEYGSDAPTIIRSTGNPTTAQSRNATVLIDTGATFQADGVIVGDFTNNDTDGSSGLVVSVDSETQITHEFLSGGTNDDWELTDTYTIKSTNTEGPGAGYPENMIAPLVLQLTESTTNYEPLEIRPLSWLRRRFSATTIQGLPGYYAYHDDLIILDIEPTLTYSARLDYIEDVGLPTYSFASSIWTFLDEDGAALTASYTNPWFEEAEDILRYAAQMKLTRWLRDDRDKRRVKEDYDIAIGRVKDLSTLKQPSPRLLGHYP